MGSLGRKGRKGKGEGAAGGEGKKGKVKKRRPVWGIGREMLMGILEIAREKYPNEFVALLVHKGGVIREITLLPGTVEGTHHAIILTHMAPPDLNFTVVGSVHSHPSPSYRPSEADLHMFSKQGHTHIIVAVPFDMGSWQAYDNRGRKIRLEVVD